MSSANTTPNYYIVLILIFNTCLICGGTFWKLNKEVINSKCSLSGHVLLRYYLIKCPATDIQMHVILGPGNRTKIKCFDLEYSKFQQILPNLTIGASSVVEIRDCPLPQSKPISIITQQLGIFSFENLIFNNKHKIVQNLSKVHFSNLTSLRNLTLVLNSVTTVPDDLFNDLSLKSLQTLDLYSNVSELPQYILTNLPSIDFIALGRNLHSLPFDIFRHQSNLIELTLSDNNLTSLPKDLFGFSSTLKSLTLENNHIEILDPDIFASLTNLIRLNLSGNIFISLPLGLLRNNKKLTEFSLGFNRIPLKFLPSNLLADLPNLYEVLLECGLEQLPANIFQNSKNIISLTMTGNKFKGLPQELFQSQQYMKYLNISNNQLQHLPETFLQNSTDLEIFDVSYNNLSTFKSHIFKACSRLEVLLYNNNKLTTENTHILWSFRFHRNLKTLNLSNNLISSISGDWTVPYFLEIFDLSHNKFTVLRDTELISLIIYNLELILTYNQITTIYLQNVTLGYKDFQNQILKIDLNNNPVECDCRMLSFVQLFKTPTINYKLMENIQFLVKDLTCLEPIDLRGKPVKNLEPSTLLCEYKDKCPTECTCSIRSFDQMLAVNCSKKNLTKIPMLPTITVYSLEGIELDMQNNHLSSLPNSSTLGYANVTTLLVANNHLRHIEGYQLPVNLSYLDTRGNYLETLNIDTIMFMNGSKLSQVYLSNNSWMCNCDVRPLLRFAQNNVQLFKDFSNMTCANTEHHTFFYDLHDLCPIERKFYVFVFIFLTVICLSLTLYYKYQTEIKIWLYAHNMCLWLVIEDELDQSKVYDAFISYSARDEDFVLDILLPELENGRPSFRLCVHVRDWLVGECIPDQILRSIAISKKTIVVLTTNFIESVWAKMEFKAAHQAALTEGRAKVIVIIYKDIGNVEALDEDLKAYLKMNTYLKWGDPWFWEKLRYAMPHITRDHNRLFENVQMQDMWNRRR